MPNTTSTRIINLQGQYGAQYGHQQTAEHVSHIRLIPTCASGLHVWNIDVMAGTKKVIKCLMQRVQDKLQDSVSISWNTQKC